MGGYLRGRRGWILIDALTGALIVTIALGAIAMAFYQASGTAANATNYVRAVYLSQLVLDDLKRQIDGQAAMPALTKPTLPNSPDTVFTVDDYFGPVAVTDSQSPAQTVPNVYYIRATVSWTENGRPRSVAAGSYYYLSP
jgi:hypothetical protein